MYPKSTTLDKVNCLGSLVALRSACPVGTVAPPFYLEDIEGFNIKKMASLASSSELKGAELANFLIGSAAREMMADIELMLNTGYSMRQIIGDVCSTCNLLPVYTANTGIIIKAATPTNYSTLKITRLNILANVTGTRTIAFNDGVETKTVDVALQSGVIMPAELDYETREKKVKVSFTDATVGLGQIVCETKSSCGCGGSATAASPVSISGTLGGNEVSTQYGFLPCVSVGCSYDALVCNLIQQTPNIFGLALLFKIGDKFLVTKSQSERNNEAAAFNDTPEELQRNFGQLYWAKMKGSKNNTSIARIISEYLKTKRGDSCVICESKVSTAYVVG